MSESIFGVHPICKRIEHSYHVHWFIFPDQIANILWIIKKAREFQKNIYFCFIDYAKSLWLCRSQSTVENSERWEYQTTWPASWETYMQVRKQQLELDMEQQTGSK